MPGLATDLLLVLKESDSHDLTLVCSGGEQLKVHQFILVARSVVFKNMMDIDMEEKRTGRVKIKDFDREVVSEFVNYLYSDKISENFSELPKLLKMGHKYEIYSLVDECSKRLEKELTTRNIFQLGSLAETYQVSQLSEKCANFLAENWDYLDPDKLDTVSVPAPLLRKTVGAMRKGKFPSFEISPLTVNSVTQYPTNISKNLKNIKGVANNTPIETSFKVVSRRVVNLSAVGLFINNIGDIDFLPVKFTFNNSGAGERFFTTELSTPVMGELVPVKLRLPVSVTVIPGFEYKLQIKFGEDVVIMTPDDVFKDDKFPVPMEEGDIEIVIQEDHPQIPVLYFEVEDESNI